MKKKVLAMLLAVVLLAMTALPAMAAAPKVKDTDYEGSGVVEVEFRSKKVAYKNAKVVVKNAAGKSLSVRILEKDNDDISFKVSGLAAGARYTYVISGVRDGKSGSYGSVKGTFQTPSGKPKIKKVKYDRKDKEIEVDFATKVQYKNLKVVVKDASGRKLSVNRVERGDDDLDIRVSGIKAGKKYTVTVSGVRVKGKGNYITLSKAFTA